MKKNVFFVLLTFLLLSNPLNAWILSQIKNKSDYPVTVQFFRDSGLVGSLTIEPHFIFTFDYPPVFPQSDLTVSHDSLINQKKWRASKKENYRLVYDGINVSNYLIIHIGLVGVGARIFCCEAKIKNCVATWMHTQGRSDGRVLYYSCGCLSPMDFSRTPGTLVIKNNGISVKGLNPAE